SVVALANAGRSRSSPALRCRCPWRWRSIWLHPGGVARLTTPHPASGVSPEGAHVRIRRQRVDAVGAALVRAGEPALSGGVLGLCAGYDGTAHLARRHARCAPLVDRAAP